MHEDAAREAFGSDDVVKLASNESPWGPHPAVVEAIAGAAAGLNRYPDQHARRLRRRIAERFEIDPARVAVGNGSCEILLAAAEALCEPGDELLFAWPSFSIYPHLAALSGAREIRVPARRRLRARPRRDARRGHRGDPARLRLQSQQPDRHPPSAPSGSRSSANGVPDHVTVALDEAYVEFQTDDDPDATVDLLAEFPNLVVLRTFSKVHGLAGLRCGYALCSARLPRARSTRSASRSASTSWPRWPRPRRSSTPTTSPSGSSARSSSGCSSRRDSRSSASSRPARRRTSPGCRSATATRPR